MMFTVGNGECIFFWSDMWIENVVPKEHFPRIFALACNKLGKVKDYGSMQDGRWTWHIQLRRSLFGWEVQQWENLMSLLKECVINPDFRDMLVWKHSTSGMFSAKSFYKAAAMRNLEVDGMWKLVWTGFSPSKVEVFMWQLIKGKVAVKDELMKRGCFGEEVAACSICAADVSGNDVLPCVV
ncbi:hypothetical protein COLO4_11923 [Corchorus olitorius]|uniref:Reverse transcriptase zinc-binding domain-containing protein n=1 Tax=Corchorus olitorius TaxID=93759 RepID=A0A1R3K2Q0_9ROSI|nr:hypothetical protein COLO4_11923 [Corchorus olitorius]